MRNCAVPLRHIVAIGLWGLTIPVASHAQSVSDDEQQIVRLEDEWRTARIEGDIAFLERLYAREFTITGADGSVISRDADIAGFASAAIKPESIVHDDMKVRIYGDTAVVTGRDTLKGRYGGAYGEGAVRFTHVFVRRDGRWQIVASQGTWVQKK